MTHIHTNNLTMDQMDELANAQVTEELGPISDAEERRGSMVYFTEFGGVIRVNAKTGTVKVMKGVR